MAQSLQVHKCTLVLDQAKWSSWGASLFYWKFRQAQRSPGMQRLKLWDPVPNQPTHHPYSNWRTVDCKELQGASQQLWDSSCSSEVQLLWTWSSLLALWFEILPSSRSLLSLAQFHPRVHPGLMIPRYIWKLFIVTAAWYYLLTSRSIWSWFSFTWSIASVTSLT